MPKLSRDNILTLLLFLILATAFYLVGYWLIYRLGRATPLMLSVGVAAILTCVIRRRNLAALGWRWGQWRWQWLSYVIPLGLAALSYALIVALDPATWLNTTFIAEQRESFNLPQFSDAGIVAIQLLITATISFMLALPSVLGEEVAWRGFLVPELARSFSFTSVALISGGLWALWHWPLILLGLYGNDVTPTYFQLITFSAFIVGLSMTMTYLRYKTGSLWTAVVFHMSLEEALINSNMALAYRAVRNRGFPSTACSLPGEKG
ncbi:MAG: hypothetical protein DHS20C11_11650 [Lysobacteraceae bacterium]|nr:MAG: hypothetical protein DHS20C11_11650 [Xanthomonadaceae bacterium]